MRGCVLENSPLLHFWSGGMQTEDSDIDGWYEVFSDGAAGCWPQTQLGRQLDTHNILVLCNAMPAFQYQDTKIDIVAKGIVKAIERHFQGKARLTLACVR